MAKRVYLVAVRIAGEQAIFQFNDEDRRQDFLDELQDIEDVEYAVSECVL